MWIAYRAAKNDELERIKLGLLGTLLLGIAFCVTQYFGWNALVDQGLYLVNPKAGRPCIGFICICDLHAPR